MGGYNLKLQDGTSDANQVVIEMIQMAVAQSKYPQPTGGWGWVCSSPGALNIPDYLIGETLGIELVGFRLLGSSHSMIFYYFGNDDKRYNVFRIFEPFYLGDSWDTDGDAEIFPSMGRGLKKGLGSWERLWRWWYEFE
jgi:hypothetical protein